jgi:hypothetical protein
MIRMPERVGNGVVGGFLIINTILFFGWEPLFAQEAFSASRDKLMAMAISNDSQDRERVIRDTMVNMQLKNNQRKSLQAQTRGFSPFATQVHPYLSSTIDYYDKNNNTDDKRSVVIFNNNVGVNTNFIGKDKFMNFDFSFSDTRESQRSTGDADSATARFFTSFILKKMTFTVSDTYFTNYVAGEDLGVEEETFNYFWRNSFNTSLSTRFNRLGFNFGYERVDTNYKNSSAVSTEEPDSILVPGGAPGGSNAGQNIFSFSSYYKLAPKTTASFSYQNNGTAYTKETEANTDFYANNYSLGLSSVLSPKVTAGLGTSYNFTSYSQADDPKQMSYTGSLGYAVSDRSDLEYGVSFGHHMEEAASAYYDTYGFSLSGNHRFIFNPKIRFSFSAHMDRSLYKKIEPTQIEKMQSYSMGLAYAFRQWLDFSVTYRYNRFDYNTDEADYGRHSVQSATNARF